MNRSESLDALRTVALAADVPVTDVQIIDAEPKPLLFVLRVDVPVLAPAAAANIRALWQALWDGKPPAKLVILTQAMELEAVLDPREK